MKLFEWFQRLFEPKQKKVETESVASIFRPKRRNRWVFRFDPLDAFLVSSIQLPIVGDFSQLQEFFVNFHNVEGIPTNEILNGLVNLDDSESARPATFKFIDAVGNVVEEWEFENVRVQSFGLDFLSYSDADPVNTMVKFSYEHVVIRDPRNDDAGKEEDT